MDDINKNGINKVDSKSSEKGESVEDFDTKAKRLLQVKIHNRMDLVALLNNLYPLLQANVIKQDGLDNHISISQYKRKTITGPPHKPIFTMCIEVNGKKYTASGLNKKTAKNNCARPAIVDLRKNYFGDQVFEDYEVESENNINDKKTIANLIGESEVQIPKKTTKPPIHILSDIRPHAVYTVLNPEKAVEDNYLMQVDIDNDIYKAEGVSKRDAKHEVALLACIEKFGIVFTQINKVSIKEENDRVIPSESNKNAIAFLFEFKPRAAFECKNPNKSPSMSEFIYECSVDGKVFKGSARSKKSAKLDSANKACISLFPRTKFTGLNQNNGDLNIDVSPMALLNENYPGEFEVFMKNLEEKKDNETTIVYECSVIINSEPPMTFSKKNVASKTARKLAAQMAIDALQKSGDLERRKQYHIQRRAYKKPSQGQRTRGLGFNQQSVDANAIIVLAKEFGNVVYTSLGCDVNGNSKMSVWVNDMTFMGSGPNQQIAKQQAAQSAVRGLNIGGSKQRRTTGHMGGFNAGKKRKTGEAAEAALSKKNNFWKKGATISNDGMSWKNQDNSQLSNNNWSNSGNNMHNNYNNDRTFNNYNQVNDNMNFNQNAGIGQNYNMLQQQQYQQQNNQQQQQQQQQLYNNDYSSQQNYQNNQQNALNTTMMTNSAYSNTNQNKQATAVEQQYNQQIKVNQQGQQYFQQQGIQSQQQQWQDMYSKW